MGRDIEKCNVRQEEVTVVLYWKECGKSAGSLLPC